MVGSKVRSASSATWRPRRDRPAARPLRIDSAICLVGGAAVAAFAGGLADDLGVDNTVAVRSVGLFLVGYGIVLAVVARAAPRTVEMSGRLSALADASWVLATVTLIAADAFSSGGDVIIAVAAIPVAALGVAKVIALRAPADVSRTAEAGLPRPRAA
jgi:hypothetical protein